MAASAPASLNWTGEGDAISLFQEANWKDDSGTTPAAGTIDGGVAVTADTGSDGLITISSGTGTPENAGSYFNIGNNSLTLSGGKTLAFYATGGNNGCVIAQWAQNDQVLSVSEGATLGAVDARNFTTVTVDGGTIALTGNFSGQSAARTDSFSISNGGSVTANKIGLIFDEAITVDSTSSLMLTTATEPPFANVHLSVGAKLTLSSRNYFTTYGSNIFVGGVSYAADSSILSFNGNTATAVSDEVLPELRVLTYNIHGGKGPDNEGTPEANLTAFRNNFMNDEDLLCLQEVDNGDCWTAVQAVFSDYPYRFRTINQETDYWPWETPKQTSIAILSKYPFVSTDKELIQVDPQYDQWERHAQHVSIQMGEDVVDIFHFHNTYNFNDNDWEYEKAGLISFRDYVYTELGISSLDQAERLIMLGDFNLLEANVVSILDTPAHRFSGRDHICSMPLFSSDGKYATVAADLSDHPALWASLDVQAPEPDPAVWAVAPRDAGTNSIYMVATNALDISGVEYYFSNTSFADGSHDSGWQNSPEYIDTGLSSATTCSYTVQTRDKSPNANTSTASEELSATTDDGDSLPNDWELTHFNNLNTSSGGATEDWDEDGMSDWEEWVAGTHPGDPASLLLARVHSVGTSTGSLCWEAVSGKIYRVHSCSALGSNWIVHADNLEATVPTNCHDISMEDYTSRFYRVEVVVP